MRRFAIACFLAGLSLSVATAEPVKSGLEPGKKVAPYSFHVATGPERGQQTCYICETGGRPAVLVFARSLTPSLGKLLDQCDQLLVKQPKEGGRGWATILGEKTVDLDSLAKWSKEQGLKLMPVGVFDDPVGPPAYRLHADADVTVMLFTARKVTHRFSFRANELTDSAIATIVQEFTAIAPPQK
ncbi:hypothetical protein [Tuwongella immobilis]|uniref:Uncharacterized protein n=1 Tax=Tuwongella immobilis TaxID=692036 RepID=A0A6C2YR31_9BACT|nr:hypothetical protein [Tuwongella immobilis]VIP03817.1 Uncharacterized protein OS=Planctomyces brasiliensis (strain ATCC 49424 / DSM 5305 / JCM 21570 / NBRC 103401 / IFAM 1448) GN=Plabr_2110 PE=4 SV=1 [Tuwongella immobilis]VTS05001.1 Uncharacterized protein OS=Planctomyces brasiliensis (strain ATCC 49424 / DSM 5305 / JCM 21570 / NBRC 103401 / IFAM 1448) GN=Plabr_2110 PE=4 SV=1 [Tuwongella immobilis]